MGLLEILPMQPLDSDSKETTAIAKAFSPDPPARMNPLNPGLAVSRVELEPAVAVRSPSKLATKSRYA